jgi:hypothetical protein
MHLNYFLNITFELGSLNLKLTFFKLHLVTKRPQSKWSRYQHVTWMLVHHGPLRYLVSYINYLQNGLFVLLKELF